MSNQNQYVIVDPKKRTVTSITCDSIFDAERAAGLNPGEVDHGSLSRRVGYVVYQFGAFVPPSEQSYCSIAGHLIAGPAVFYGCDEGGETVDLRKSELPDVRWYLEVNDVEAAIERDEIVRPIIAVNGIVLWEWPQPAPEGFGYGN